MKKTIIGKYVNLYDVDISDAEFILQLRTSERAKLLQKTEYNIDKQIEYIQNYNKKENEYYFIIKNKSNEKLGTIRIHDIIDNTFQTGSWLIREGASFQEVIESQFLVKNYGFNTLNLSKNLFFTSIHNHKIITISKSIYKAQIAKVDSQYYYFELKKEVFEAQKNKIIRFFK